MVERGIYDVDMRKAHRAKRVFQVRRLLILVTLYSVYAYITGDMAYRKKEIWPGVISVCCTVGAVGCAHRLISYCRKRKKRQDKREHIRE